jgi:hypothetical protein
MAKEDKLKNEKVKGVEDKTRGRRMSRLTQGSRSEMKGESKKGRDDERESHVENVK